MAAVLGAVVIAAFASHRPFTGTFEAPLPVPANGQIRIANIEKERARLEANGLLTARLRQQLDAGLATEKLFKAGAVARLTLGNGTALLEYVAPGAPNTTSAPDLRYTVEGIGSARRIHFEPLTPPTGIFDPPADFIIESDDLIRPAASHQRFQRVLR